LISIENIYYDNKRNFAYINLELTGYYSLINFLDVFESLDV